MNRSRPAWLNDRISKAFTLESSPHFEGHKEVSSDEYQFGDITGAGIVQWQLARIGRCRLLDAGAGEGRFLLRRLWDWHTTSSDRNGGIDLCGVSARRYPYTLGSDRGWLSRCLHNLQDRIVFHFVPHQKPSVVEGKIRILNAERLLESPEFSEEQGTYDVILSHKLMRHLQDPLGTVVQLHSLLCTGGVLALDRLPLPGVGEGGARELLHWWHAQGYDVAGVPHHEAIGPFFLVRGPDDPTPLKVAVKYRGEQDPARGDAVYTPPTASSSGARPKPRAVRPPQGQNGYPVVDRVQPGQPVSRTKVGSDWGGYGLAPPEDGTGEDGVPEYPPYDIQLHQSWNFGTLFALLPLLCLVGHYCSGSIMGALDAAILWIVSNQYLGTNRSRW